MTGDAFFQTGADRAERRGAGVVLFRPPIAELMRICQWHMVETHLGLKRLQWRPGIDVWRGEDHERWTAEFGGANGWRYVGVSDDQTNTHGRP